MMSRFARRYRILLIVILCLIVACTSEPLVEEPAATTEQGVVPRISVTGKLVPETWSGVAAASAGKVTQVLVKPGDVVAAGDVLVQLDNRAALNGVTQAEAARQQARAELALLKAGTPPETVAVAAAQVEAARAALTQTLAQRDQLWTGQLAAQIAALEAQLAAAQAEQLVARQTHDDTMRCYQVDQPDGSQKEVCPTLGTLEERARFALHAVNQQVAALEAQKLALKQDHWAQVQVLDAAIAAAEQQVAIAEAQLAQLKAWPTPEEIALGETAVAQAEAAVAAARLQLDATAVLAPFAGTVGAVDVRAGEFATPGVSLVTLGDLTTLYVETTDLDEIDVGRTMVGQQAVVTFDALPDRTFVGTVLSIAPMATPGGGGVNYRVTLELDELAPVLRWGMTAFVDIEAK
ncbi:MAG: efflux RND transporter periplasmic adaptor subunit [Anaerolineae bacterium]|nr:efflux RND transporter periplasmic adaptor subunit [Anaerolineae bacterium]